MCVTFIFVSLLVIRKRDVLLQTSKVKISKIEHNLSTNLKFNKKSGNLFFVIILYELLGITPSKCDKLETFDKNIVLSGQGEN